MTLADTRMRRDIQKELVKREIESNLINVSVVNAVVYLEGELRPIRGVIMNPRREREIIEEVITRMKGVRDVVNNLKVPL
jgi:osmotically-inducible protein OsmY